MHFFSLETPGHSGWAETPRTDRTGGADLIQVINLYLVSNVMLFK